MGTNRRAPNTNLVDRSPIRCRRGPGILRLLRGVRVLEADVAVDGLDRPIIPGREFVMKHGVKTVFGMGGGYADGALAIAIIFADETLDRMRPHWRPF